MTVSTPGTALITGASSGIGAVYADHLARRGYDLILVARDGQRLSELAARLQAETGRAVEVLRADLTDRADLAVVEARLAADAGITLLVNNAGKSMNGTILDVAPAEVEQLIALNVTAPTLLAGAAARAFAGREQGGIINIASVLALAPEMFDGVYSGSKAFLLNLTQSLAAPLAAKGVRIQAVLPGATRTEIWERSGKDIDALLGAERIMDADDLVAAALAGYDRGETVTIPPLPDEAQWETMQAARLAMGPNLSLREVAPRYRVAA
ncbi:SDR family NAD(P)-dependent oxidoreductase [Sphingomonas quercus]|uniref:SDR family NAD(P)-dependent oxidoreductase n=1 Tax=Sphingomonas quercus TaxID=2842451 RepID=A0ABS6BJN9_9SPHN|nr:SDR family NAD(P)-dependent oxidoreductase [Sphingomonas quercus]MBU3077454.1 SDR family NAD(P)-dependent oxidoreductase [Sphingomonas quercus]